MRHAPNPEPEEAASLPQRSRRGCLLLALVAVALLGYIWLRAGTRGVPIVATVTGETGEVYLRHADAEDERVYAGQVATLQRGDTLDTGLSGEATLSIGENSVFVAGNTVLQIEQLEKAPFPRGPRIALFLEEGEIDAGMEALGWGGAFHVDTGILTIDGSQFRCVVAEGESVSVQAYGGTLKIEQGRESVNLQRGQRLLAVPGQPMQVEGEVQVDPTRTPRSGPTRAPIIELDKTLFPVVQETRTWAASGTTYTVQSGDTLYSIATDFGLEWTALWEANRDTVAAPELLREGQVLRIPQP